MVKLILFGAGGGGKKVFQIIDYKKTKIVAFVDNDPGRVGKKLEGIVVVSPDEINDYEYDWILISSTFYEDITKQLIGLGINKKKIISTIKYLQILFEYHLDEYLKRKDKVQAIITGLSYAEFGFDLEYLKPCTYNFAMGMQDLYCDYHIAKYILERNGGFRKLKYCIIGLAYYSFEYDLSLSKFKHCIFRYSDILDTYHNNEQLKREDHRIKKIFKKIFKEDCYSLFYNLEKSTLQSHFEKVFCEFHPSWRQIGERTRKRQKKGD